MTAHGSNRARFLGIGTSWSPEIPVPAVSGIHSRSYYHQGGNSTNWPEFGEIDIVGEILHSQRAGKNPCFIDPNASSPRQKT